MRKFNIYRSRKKSIYNGKEKYFFFFFFRLYITVQVSVFLYACSLNQEPEFSFCECVGYIKHQLQITCNGCTANAKDWGTVYMPNGFEIINDNPQKGDLIVITPAVGSYWSDSEKFLNFGHIGIIESIKIEASNYTIITRGALQDGTKNECGCNNVENKTFTLPISYRDKIRILRKENPYFCYSYKIGN
jgi:hypothetical protein